MTQTQKIELRLSQIRTELRKIAETETITPELRERTGVLKTELSDCETRLQAALLADDASTEPVVTDTLDAETRERQNLRSRVRLWDFFKGSETGRFSTEIREYQSACGARDGGIPIDYFESSETRAVTPAPSSGTGVNVQRIVPALFAKSAAAAVGIDMPRVSSGASSWLRITTNQTASFKAKGAAQAATAGALTSVSTTPHRLSARLEINTEAIAEVGTETFEAQLRSNLMMVLSNTLDRALLSGSGSGNTIRGLLNATGLTKPSAETTTDTFALARAKITNIAQDGIFASSLKDCGLLVGTDTGRYFDGLFWNSSGDSPIVLSDHLRMSLMNYSSSANLPAPASDAQFAFLCRRGTSEQLAVAPMWGSIAIDDIYSGAASAQTSYNLHILTGDVLVLQPAAFQILSFKIA